MSVPLSEMAALLSSGQATMRPQDAALAAQQGTPFAFPATAANLAAFEGAMAPRGTVAPLTSSGAQAASNTIYNQYLLNAGGGAALQKAGLSVPASGTPRPSASAFSWLDPWPWVKAEALNGILIALGVTTVIIIVGAIFRQATQSTPALYVRGSAQTLTQGARAAKSVGSRVAGALAVPTEIAAAAA